MTIEGARWSKQRSILCLTLAMNSTPLATAFSAPYSISVFFRLIEVEEGVAAADGWLSKIVGYLENADYIKIFAKSSKRAEVRSLVLSLRSLELVSIQVLWIKQQSYLS